MHIYFEEDFQEQAQHYQAVLCSRGVTVDLQPIERLNARFLRFNPEIALCVDENGLWLSANGMKMQPDWISSATRRIQFANSARTRGRPRGSCKAG